MNAVDVPVATPWDVSPTGETVLGATTNWVGRTMPTPWPAAYGGDLTVGALAAAYRTVDAGRVVHSLNMVFVRPADKHAPLRYEVTVVRDGFRYSARHVSVIQGDVVVATVVLSFRLPQGDRLEQHDFPHTEMFANERDPHVWPTAAEALSRRGPSAPGTAHLDQYWAYQRGLDVRHTNENCYGTETVIPRSTNTVWVRLVVPPEELLGPDCGIPGISDRMGAATIAYIADDTILESALAFRGWGWNTPGLFSTSIDQKIWFHGDAVPGRWLLFRQRLVSAHGSNVVCEGHLFDVSGALVATVMQEGIVARRSHPSPAGSAG